MKKIRYLFLLLLLIPFISYSQDWDNGKTFKIHKEKRFRTKFGNKNIDYVLDSNEVEVNRVKHKRRFYKSKNSIIYEDINGMSGLLFEGKRVYYKRGNRLTYSDTIPYNCTAIDTMGAAVGTNFSSLATNPTRPLINKTLNLYWEVSNGVFRSYLSRENLITDLNFLFQTYKLIYENEGIKFNLLPIKVWETPDPYASITSINTVLFNFSQNNPTIPTNTFYQFLSERSFGGLGYITTYNYSTVRYSVCGFGVGDRYGNYSATSYNWRTYVTTHEVGHNLGSPHTHWGCWTRNGVLIGRIDSCFTCQSGCTPPAPNCNSRTKPVSGGGTIMSYCHLTSTGINFNKGFGELPGNVIRNSVINSPVSFDCTPTYSNWSTCSNGIQTRTVTNGCTVSSDSLRRNCNSITPTVTVFQRNNRWMVNFFTNSTLPITTNVCRQGNFPCSTLITPTCGQRASPATIVIGNNEFELNSQPTPPSAGTWCYYVTISQGNLTYRSAHFIVTR